MAEGPWLWLWLAACAPTAPSPWSQPADPAVLPTPPGACDGFEEVWRTELGTTMVAGSPVARATPTTVWSTGQRELPSTGEVYALLEVEDALFAALGTAGLARLDPSPATWPVPGEVVGLRVDGDVVVGIDHWGREVQVPLAAGADHPPTVRVVDGVPGPVPRPVVDRITGLAALPDGGLVVGLVANGAGAVLWLDADGVERARVDVVGEPRGLVVDEGAVWVAAVGLLRVTPEGVETVALTGEDVRDVALSPAGLAAWTPTRGLTWFDRAPPHDPRGEVPPRPGTFGTSVAWWRGHPVVGTRLYGFVEGPALLRALPMPTSDLLVDGGQLWAALPDAGVAHVDGDGAMQLDAFLPGARGLARWGDGWVAAVGTHGLRTSAGERCDLPGTARHVVALGDGRLAVATDAMVVLLQDRGS